MTKRFLPIVLVSILLITPTVAHAQEEISLLDSTAEVFFPSALVFNIKAESSSDITKVRLHYQVDKMNYAQVTSEAWPDFAPSPKVETQWTWDMRRVSLPAGAMVQYWWTIEDKAGNTLITTADVVRFDDLRYSWQSLTEGQLKLFWYEGSRSFAEELMAASQQALERLAQDTGAYPEKRISVYVYADSKDLRSAMIFPREWTGGVAFTEFGIIAVGVSEEQLDWGKGALAHELGHSVIHQITFSPYGAILPTWLDEGLAMHAEGELDPYLQSWLEAAVSKQRLISVRSLSSPFSAKAEEAYISYAQSQSLVQFLLQNYGKDNVLRLLILLKEGNSCDEALTQVYGFNQDGLDELWREYIVSQAESESRFEPVPPWRVSQKETLRIEVPGTLVTSNAPTIPLDKALLSNHIRHSEPITLCHSEPFTLCHSEGAERPKNLAQGKLPEECFALLRTAFGDPSLPPKVTSKHVPTRGSVN